MANKDRKQSLGCFQICLELFKHKKISALVYF